MLEQTIYEEEGSAIDAADLDKQAVADLIGRLERKESHLSFSAIKAFMQSPRHFLAYKLRKDEPTPAMIFGDLVDCVITSPDELQSRFVVLPDGASFVSHDGLDVYCDFLGIDLPRTAAKVDERKEAVRAKLAQITQRIVSADDMAKADRIGKNLWANEAGRYLLEGCTQTQREVSFNAFDWDWRGRLDLFGDMVGIADMKMMPSAKFIDAYRTIERMNYETQAAIYRYGVGVQDMPFYFLCFERSGHCCVIELSQGRIDNAWNLLGEVMERFEECITFNEWHKSYDFWARRHSGIYTM